MDTAREVTIGCSLLLALTASAAQQTPVIHVDTRLVQVDVVVRNGKGPVRDLTKEDFTLFEKGKPREIALFKMTEAHSTREASGPLPPGVVSNRLNQRGEAPGSVTVILADRLNTPPEVRPYADRELIRFLQSAHKGDSIALYRMSGDIRVIQDFTTDMDRLIRAASHIDLERPMDLQDTELMKEVAETLKRTQGEEVASALGGKSHALEEFSQLVATDKVTRTTEALSAIAKHLAGVPGRKNLVWISASFPLLRGGRIRSNSRDYTPEVQKATRSLNEANVAVYPVDARGLTNMGFDISGLDTLNTVAGWTGGQAYYATNDLQGAIRQAIDDAEVTYTLGFYPQQGTLDGAFHDLRVKVARSGMDVRYRKGYFASDVPAPNKIQLQKGFQELLVSPLDATAVGITANGEPDPAAPGRYRLTAKVNVSDLHIERGSADAGWTGSIAVAFRAESDKSRGIRYVVVPIKLNEEQYKAALKDGFTVRGVLDTEGMVGRIHAMIQDQTTGAAGSVWIPVGK